MVSGECVSIFQGHDDWINYVTEMSNGNLSIIQIKRSNRIDFKISQSIHNTSHNHYIQCAIVNGNTELITLSADRTVKIWNLNTVQCAKSMLIGHEN
ncbi:unnamed protein product [Brachionus calyciflorus]|uniref:Uncharacterized protein n=1 Tax=Brachionus calyciflorus TaxID=104777 RepID=A0A814BM03_9BILA|nr:unnamed protein product [Brachionus calyciflorus]